MNLNVLLLIGEIPKSLYPHKLAELMQGHKNWRAAIHNGALTAIEGSRFRVRTRGHLSLSPLSPMLAAGIQQQACSSRHAAAGIQPDTRKQQVCRPSAPPKGESDTRESSPSRYMSSFYTAVLAYHSSWENLTDRYWLLTAECRYLLDLRLALKTQVPIERIAHFTNRALISFIF